MRKTTKMKLYAAAIFLAAFAFWTLALRFFDVQAIGPNASRVGFASLNGRFHKFTGVHMPLYVLTDFLGLVPAAVALGFAVLGLAQWIKRKSLLRVDRSILVLGGFYILVMAAYLFFEAVPLNYRPVLIDGRLEASYPSSTTLLVLCVMETARMQLRARIRSRAWRCCISAVIIAFTAFTVIARLVSGVHWLSDIIGGALLSAGLVLLYAAFAFRANEASPFSQL